MEDLVFGDAQIGDTTRARRAGSSGGAGGSIAGSIPRGDACRELGGKELEGQGRAPRKIGTHTNDLTIATVVNDRLHRFRNRLGVAQKCS